MTPVPVERCRQSSLVCCGRRCELRRSASASVRGRRAKTHGVWSKAGRVREVEEGDLRVGELVDERLRARGGVSEPLFRKRRQGERRRTSARTFMTAMSAQLYQLLCASSPSCTGLVAEWQSLCPPLLGRTRTTLPSRSSGVAASSAALTRAAQASTTSSKNSTCALPTPVDAAAAGAPDSGEAATGTAYVTGPSGRLKCRELKWAPVEKRRAR